MAGWTRLPERRRKGETRVGKNVEDREGQSATEVFDSASQPLSSLWPAPRFHSTVWAVPNLLQRTRATRRDSGHQQVELVDAD